MAKKAAKDPAAERAALEKALLAALQSALDGVSRPLQGSAASGALFATGAKGQPLVEAALAEQLLEEADSPATVKATKKGPPPKFARITEKGRRWVAEQGDPRAIAEGLRDILASQGVAVDAAVEAAEMTLAELNREVVRLQQTLRHEVERYRQTAQALRQVLGQAKAVPAAEAAWLDDAVRIVAEHKQRNALTRPTLPQIYEQLRSAHPGLSLAQFHDGLRMLHVQKRIRLGPYTLALATLPDHQNALYLDKEVKFYVDLP